MKATNSPLDNPLENHPLRSLDYGSHSLPPGGTNAHSLKRKDAAREGDMGVSQIWGHVGVM